MGWERDGEDGAILEMRQGVEMWGRAYYGNFVLR